MSAPWGAIIQAIDHAMGRMNEGASAGIKVAKSQSGGAAPATNMSSDAGSSATQDLSNLAKNNDTGSEQAEVAEKAKIGSNASTEGVVPSSSNQGGDTSKSLGNIGNIGGDIGGGDTGDGDDSSAAADAAGSILSDENTKSAKEVSSDKKKDEGKDKSKVVDKLGAARSYGAGVGQGFANAGAIATGNSDAVEWKDIQVAKAKEAAEDTVKNWQKQRQEAKKEQKSATNAEGK